MFRGNPQRTGSYTGQAPISQIEFNPIVSSPSTHPNSFLLCSEKRIYTVQKQKTFYHLSAWDRVSGLALWSREGFEPIQATPLEHDLLYVSSLGCGLFALDPQTGDQVWNAVSPDSFFVSPLWLNGLIWCGSPEGQLVGLDPQTGTVQSLYSFAEGFFSSFAGEGQQLIWGTADGHVVLFDVELGSVVWQRALAQPVLTTPILSDAYVFVSSSSGRIFCLSRASGELLWEYRLQAALKFPCTVDQERLFAISGENHVVALDVHTGRPVWSEQQKRSIALPPVAANGMLFTGFVPRYGEEPYMALIDQSNGELWFTWSQWTSTTAVEIVDGMVYSSPAGGSVCAATGQFTKPLPVEPVVEVVVEKPIEKPTLNQQRAVKVQQPVSSRRQRHSRSLEWSIAQQPDVYPSSDPQRAVVLALRDADLSSSGGMHGFSIDKCNVSLHSGVRSVDGTLWNSEHEGMLFSQPIVVEGWIYISSLTNQFVGAYALETGELLWSASIDAGTHTGVVVGDFFCLATGQHLWVLDRFTGDIVAQRKLPATAASELVVADGIAYVGCATGIVCAVWVDTVGEPILWTYKTSQSIREIHPPMVYGNMLIFSSNSKQVIALDRFSGECLWEYATQEPCYAHCIRDGVVYVAEYTSTCTKNGVFKDETVLSAIDATAYGVLLWKTTVESDSGRSLAVDTERIYVPCDGCVYALDRLDGSVVWQSESLALPFGGSNNLSAITLMEHGILFLTAEHELHLIDRKTGRPLWQLNDPFDSTQGAYFAIDKLIVCADWSGQLFVLKDMTYQKGTWSDIQMKSTRSRKTTSVQHTSSEASSQDTSATATDVPAPKSFAGLVRPIESFATLDNARSVLLAQILTQAEE